MSRLVHRPIKVVFENGKPISFVDAGTNYQISMIRDTWVESGYWWEGEGQREVYQVITQEGFMYDIEVAAGEWYLYRVWD